MEAAYRNFWPRVAGRLRWQSVTALNAVASPMEWLLTASPRSHTEQPLLFIIGPPRCGSTLLYQAMVNRFDVGYFSNTHALFFRLPTVIERTVRLTRAGPGGDYHSVLGNTHGWWAPSEAGRFWYRFFARPSNGRSSCAVGDVLPARREALVTALRSFADACGRAVVLKNLFSTLRVDCLAEWLPESRFIVMRRDEVEIGRSLLAARWNRFGNFETWFSVPPPNIEQLRCRPPHEQVIEQSRAIYRLIAAHQQRWGCHRFHEVDYQRLCDDPRRELDNLSTDLAGRGAKLGFRSEVPDSFRRPETTSIPGDLNERMVDYAHATR